MIAKLKKRWSLPMDTFWKKFQRACIAFAIVVPTTGELAEYMNFLPEGTITTDIKTIGGVIITLGILIPKFTVHEDHKDEIK